MTNETHKPCRSNSHTKPPSINLSHPTHAFYRSGRIASCPRNSERPARSSKLFPTQLKHRARPTHPVQVGQPLAALSLIYLTQTLLHSGPSRAPPPQQTHLVRVARPSKPSLYRHRIVLCKRNVARFIAMALEKPSGSTSRTISDLCRLQPTATLPVYL